MIKIITFKQETEWNDVVSLFKSHDVYYLHGYVEAFMLHGDGDPVLFYYKSDSGDLQGLYVAMKRDLSLWLRWLDI